MKKNTDFMENIPIYLAKREYFALLALQGLLSQTTLDSPIIARKAVRHADYLIEALAETSSTDTPINP